MVETCECGHEFCRGYKLYMVDPYLLDLYDEVKYEFMCHGDQYERAMDI